VDGDPGWQTWDDSHPVRIFEEGAPYVAYGPRDPEFALWATDAETKEVAVPVEGTPPARSATELRSVVRRLRRTGDVRRSS
jgi:para-nitrobenzyl esterase